MTEEIKFFEIEELRMLASHTKNKVLKKLVDFYDSVTKSPYYDSYVSILSLMKNLNEDLKSEKITLFVGVSSDGDGNAIIDEKTFVNSHKYATEIKSYHEQLEYLRSKMLPQEIERADEEAGEAMDIARSRLKKKPINGERQ